jgi:DNA-binding beta-propeller fold protein YncE
MQNMKKSTPLIRILSFLSVVLLAASGRLPAQGSGFRVNKIFHIASTGGWDYIAVGPGNDRLYVSHGTQVNILNESTGDSVGVILNTIGVHGIAFVPALGKGYTSNGRLNNVTVFDLNTNQILGMITAGTNPDAIMYDDYSKMIITCNGRSQDLSLIDPVAGKLMYTIPVNGKPETAVSDGKGKIYVNIEDMNQIVEVDIVQHKVTNRWPLTPAEGPTGLAFDIKNNRLFAGCDKMLAAVDAGSGKVINYVPIPGGCDGVVFDAELGLVFASCGSGQLSIIKGNSNGLYDLVENIPTKASARTLALNQKTHTIYLPAGEFQKATVEGTRPPLVPGTFQILVVKR